MNIENIEKLKATLEEVLKSETQNNERKPNRYWYPLGQATYGVEEILEALDSLCSFRTSMADKTLQFERSFSKYQGSSDAVMVNSGSSADLLLCFLLANPLKPLVKPGDEILVPVVTWPTQIWSAKMAGLSVKLLDVRPDTLNLDLDDLERKIGPKTKALFLVHLMGNPCEMDRILQIANKHGLHIIEDCCEGLGAEWNGKKIGNFGLGGAFSFFFSHHMTTMEGGMISCSSVEMAEQIKLLRAHGWVRNVDPSKFGTQKYPDIDPRYLFVNWGFNVRPTEVQAGFGIRQLEKLPFFNSRREEIAKRFFDYISKTRVLSPPKVHPLAKPSWLALPLIISKEAPFKRAELLDFLERNGIETRPVVTGNIAKQPVSEIFPEFRETSFPGADEIHERGFYIGLSPLSSNTDITRLIGCFEEFLSKHQ